jgi:hypothetical protein
MLVRLSMQSRSDVYRTTNAVTHENGRIGAAGRQANYDEHDLARMYREQDTQSAPPTHLPEISIYGQRPFGTRKLQEHLAVLAHQFASISKVIIAACS